MYGSFCETVRTEEQERIIADKDSEIVDKQQSKAICGESTAHAEEARRSSETVAEHIVLESNNNLDNTITVTGWCN